MSIQKILVTGANGQLGWELSQLAAAYPKYQFVMVDRTVLDLSKPESINAVLDTIAPDAIINPAAYTAVDKAETEKELAYTINAKSVEVMAAYAAAKQIPFISYSTDYVFTGDAFSPYTTDTAIAPLNFYGSTKADGESLAFAANPNTIIIRTSWVFSSHGNNFVKTMTYPELLDKLLLSSYASMHKQLCFEFYFSLTAKDSFLNFLRHFNPLLVHLNNCVYSPTVLNNHGE